MSNGQLEQFDVIVLGAGAAGMMCAMTAGSRGRRVLLLDHSDEVGKKILISGGGHCNFTNFNILPERFLSNNPHFCKSALAGYSQHDFISLINRHRISWHEKTLGQLFCDGSSRAVVRMLLDECAASSVDVRTAHHIVDVSRSDRFHVTTDKGRFTAVSVVLATGGLSIPKMGATGLAHDIGKRFELSLSEIRPGLVPLTFEGDTLDLMRSLSGISLDCHVTGNQANFREGMLFTHRGLSGPAILQISSYLRGGEEIFIDLLPDLNAPAFLLTQKRTRPRTVPRTLLSEVLPTRFSEKIAHLHLPDRPMAEQKDKTLVLFGEILNSWRLRPSSTEGYTKAEVTLGGINTDDLSSKTMEAKKVPGLFIIGEAVDVCGWLGGYNFQWAWSSGYAAGQAV